MPGIQGQAPRLYQLRACHPEKPRGEIIAETTQFDPEIVRGLYAKTRAEATRLVLDSVKEGLDAIVVHPSGIIGPNDYG